jgi:hypothetical protein
VTMTNWPKHTDGRNKKIDEMTREESRAVTKDACERLQVWFDRPEVKAAHERVINDASK